MDRLLDFSTNFVISYGSVPIDVSRGLVLLLYYPPKGEYMLPKGRKNVGESLEAAAMRETKEESGFECHLFKHQLHTNAQELNDAYHTEAIAVQQRITAGVRKLIFWFISEVDSRSEQMPDTQEEGEAFDVEWVRMEEAPSKCSFLDDRRIVEKALEAVPRPSSPMPVDQLREAYIDSSVDRQALGFHSVSPGGSIVKQQTGAIPSKVENNTDWDGFGILETKDSIIRLITHFRADLRSMLRIGKEECMSMMVWISLSLALTYAVLTHTQMPDDPSLHEQWDVLRFSGWTTEGSKRTIKLCSEEKLEKIVTSCTLSYLGLLSHKIRRCIECSDLEKVLDFISTSPFL